MNVLVVAALGAFLIHTPARHGRAVRSVHLQPAALWMAQADLRAAVSIEYCTRCNWMLRSSWLSQELLTTFNGTIGEVSLIPNHVNGGVFIIRCRTARDLVPRTLWNRATEGRFPEAKELKQRVRNLIDPNRDLGHSDVDGAEAAAQAAGEQIGEDAPEVTGTKWGAIKRLLSIVRPRRFRGQLPGGADESRGSD